MLAGLSPLLFVWLPAAWLGLVQCAAARGTSSRRSAKQQSAAQRTVRGTPKTSL